jgi:hypothetical protein
VTPLHQLLLEAIAIAKQREPGLSDSLIAYRAGITQPTLSRAKRRCGPSTLAAVLDALGLELALIAPPMQAQKQKQNQKGRAAKPRAVASARKARANASGRTKSQKGARRSGPTTFVTHATGNPYTRGSVRRPARPPARRSNR